MVTELIYESQITDLKYTQRCHIKQRQIRTCEFESENVSLHSTTQSITMIMNIFQLVRVRLSNKETAMRYLIH